MRLKRFRDVSLSACMTQVRDVFGPDALILGTSQFPGGVEVTAGVDEDVRPNRPARTPSPQHRADTSSADRSVLPEAQRSRQAQLAWHGVPPVLARRLRGGPLALALSLTMKFGVLKLDESDTTVVLTGPPGAGKTLTVVRLATRLVMRGIRPTMICADGVRAGAADQLAVFAELLGVESYEVANPVELSEVSARRLGRGAMLVDTPGYDPRCGDTSQAEAGDMMARLARLDNTKTLAVLPAGMDTSEASELAASFAEMGATGIIATRLDMARRLGSVLSSAASGLPLFELGIGPQAADGLIPATPDAVAARLLATPRTTQGIGKGL